MLHKPSLVRFSAVVWALFSVFSIFCVTSFGDFEGLKPFKTPRNHKKGNIMSQ